jgi:hypothetical protein
VKTDFSSLFDQTGFVPLCVSSGHSIMLSFSPESPFRYFRFRLQEVIQQFRPFFSGFLSDGMRLRWIPSH